MAEHKRYRTGLVIGKFLPFHKGHELLVAEAERACEQLTVVVVDAGWQDIPVEVRIDWIKEGFPGARVVSVDQDALGLDDWDTPGWAQATVEAHGGLAPDAVFSSEEYGRPWAEAMGCEHELVDLERRQVPISGTAVRSDPLANLDYLPPQVRSWFVRRVSIIGVESSGKTTLAADLAGHYGIDWLAEFGRFYTEAQPDPLSYNWSEEDFRVICETQLRFEEQLARRGGPLLIADTGPLTTALFAEAYLGRLVPELEQLAREHRYSLYLLCDPATPFTQDATGTRRDGEQRRFFDRRYRQWLNEQVAPFIELTGSRSERLEQAVCAVEDLLAPRPLANPPAAVLCG